MLPDGNPPASHLANPAGGRSLDGTGLAGLPGQIQAGLDRNQPGGCNPGVPGRFKNPRPEHGRQPGLAQAQRSTDPIGSGF